MIPSRLDELTDKELMARHVDGDPDAFGEIYRRHRDRMWAVAIRTCGDREIAADAVQEGFIAAFRRAATYRGEAAVTTWLHRIVVNACLDRLRKVKPTRDIADFEMSDGRDEHSSVVTAIAIHEALAQLPEGQRLALTLVDMHGLSVAEAAETLGVAEGTIKSRCARGRAALASILGLTGSGL